MCGDDTGEMSSSAGSGDDHFRPVAFGRGDKLHHRTGCPVRRQGAADMGNTETSEHLIGMLHDVPVGLAAHENDDLGLLI